MILGQAKRSLGALIVPSQDALDSVGGDAQSSELRSTIQVGGLRPAGCRSALRRPLGWESQGSCCLRPFRQCSLALLGSSGCQRKHAASNLTCAGRNHTHTGNSPGARARAGE